MKTYEEWHIWFGKHNEAIRKEIGLKIDPETAEVTWIGSLVVQGYRQQERRSCFARAPGSDLWVNFDDLPEATREALWKKHSSRLPEPFPVGFEPPWLPVDEDILMALKEQEDVE